MLVITCIVAAVGIFSNHQSKQAVDDMYHYNLMTTQYLNDATTQMRYIESDINYLLLATYPQENRKILLDDMTGKTKAIQADMDKIKDIDRSERAQKALEGIAESSDAFLAGISRRRRDSAHLRRTRQSCCRTLKRRKPSTRVSLSLRRITYSRASSSSRRATSSMTARSRFSSRSFSQASSSAWS